MDSAEHTSTRWLASATGRRYGYWIAILLGYLVLGVLAQIPYVAGVCVLLVGAAASVLCLVALVTGRGDLRLYAVGASLPAFFMLCAVVCVFVVNVFEGWDQLEDLEGAGTFLPITLALLPCCGMVAVVARRRLSSRNSQIVSNDEQAVGSTGREPFQFSIKAMLATTTACAVACTIGFVIPVAFASILILAAMALIVLALAVVLYVGWTDADSVPEHWRVFTLGACIPGFVMLAILVTCSVIALFGGWRFLDDSEFALGLKVGFVVLCVSGFGFGVLARRMAAALGRG